MLLLVASLYYKEGLGQSHVAKLAGISQANVSRLLTEAKKKGIVQITVKPFAPRDESVEKALREKYKLNTCVVVKSYPDQTAEQFRYTLGHFAAPIISQMVKPDSTVCVAAGRHINALTTDMKPVQTTPNVVFVQAIGDISTQIQENDAIEITRRLAKRWNGKYHRLQAPAITPDHESYKVFTSHDQIKSVLHQINNATLAIVGIGNPANSVFYNNEFSKPEELQNLKSQGIVGEICGHFIDENGNECNTVFSNRIIGIDLDQLKKIPEVVAVTSGVDRVRAVHAAISSGILKSIVIDDIGAEALLQLV